MTSERKKPTSTPTASYEVPTIPSDKGPLRTQLVNLFNRLHEAAGEGDAETLGVLKAQAVSLLDVFDRSEAELAENPAWRRATMRAGYWCAVGDHAQAVDYDKQGWEAAHAQPRVPVPPESVACWKAVSASNVADGLRRLGRHEEAVYWARLSCELWADNPVNWLVLALVLYRLGQRDETDEILHRLGQLARAHGGKNALAGCLLYERDLDQMTDLPSVRRLLTDLGRPALP